jgi:TonB family protein
MARMQKVEGTVITNVLVSETGAVLEVRVLRGVTRAVGLNEAAQQAMRRSTFHPGSKDGVRVKSVGDGPGRVQAMMMIGSSRSRQERELNAPATANCQLPCMED